MDGAAFTTVIQYTIGRATMKALIKGQGPGAQRDRIHLRLELDEEIRALLAPLFEDEESAPEDPRPKRDE